MIDPELSSVITALAATITALAPVVASVIGIITLFKVEKVHKATNSMHDALVTAAKAEGKQEQKDEDKTDRQKSKVTKGN